MQPGLSRVPRWVMASPARRHGAARRQMSTRRAEYRVHDLHVTDIVEIVSSEIEGVHEALIRLETVISELGSEDPELRGLGARIASLTAALHDALHELGPRIQSQEATSRQRRGRRPRRGTGGSVPLPYDRVGQVLISVGYEPAVVGEVEAYLRLVDDRERRVSVLVGEPRLVEAESVAQSYAASFHREVLGNVEMLDSGALVKLMQPLGNVSEVRSYTKRLRDSSEVIALKAGRTYVYPHFQFDPEKHHIRPVVAKVNRILRANQDPWGAMAWWMSENPRWGHRRPVDHPDDGRLAELAGALSDDSF